MIRRELQMFQPIGRLYTARLHLWQTDESKDSSSSGWLRWFRRPNAVLRNGNDSDANRESTNEAAGLRVASLETRTGVTVENAGRSLRTQLEARYRVKVKLNANTLVIDKEHAWLSLHLRAWNLFIGNGGAWLMVPVRQAFAFRWSRVEITWTSEAGEGRESTMTEDKPKWKFSWKFILRIYVTVHLSLFRLVLCTRSCNNYDNLLQEQEIVINNIH